MRLIYFFILTISDHNKLFLKGILYAKKNNNSKEYIYITYSVITNLSEIQSG